MSQYHLECNVKCHSSKCLRPSLLHANEISSRYVSVQNVRQHNYHRQVNMLFFNPSYYVITSYLKLTHPNTASRGDFKITVNL